jgi:hypothetical protein
MVRMIQNRESLETNIEALMNDKKLNQVHPTTSESQ